MRFDLPDDKKLCFELVIPIRWGDMDAMGHVNNANYFRYLETLRIDWFRSIGCLPDADGVGPVIINAFCSFTKAEAIDAADCESKTTNIASLKKARRC